MSNSVKNKESNKRDYTLSSVKNALLILRSFSLNESEKKVTDLANELNLAKSTVSRLLATLLSEGFVQKNPETNKYKLGLTIVKLNTIITTNLDINEIARPTMERLVDETGETAHITVLDGREIFYLYKVDCTHPIQIMTYIGARNPVHATNSGKVILANQSEETIEDYIRGGLPAYTSSTITDPEDFRRALEEIKIQGYASSDSEILEGVASIAAPIRDYTGQTVYGISITGPKPRLDPKNSILINKVKKAAKEISEDLGCWNY